jgi:UDP-N-acetylmuramyl pentapeptide synthase
VLGEMRELGEDSADYHAGLAEPILAARDPVRPLDQHHVIGCDDSGQRLARGLRIRHMDEIDVLAEEPGRHVAVLGEMRELGEDSADYHAGLAEPIP